ncbi:MAG: response regulator transcription factor [Bacteroidetes bacterium]|nr:response regulator transcription factor [Bacteroidota bacterium]
MKPGNKILLVEDEETLAIGLVFNLTEEGYSVTWAKDGKQALAFYNSNEYDLIILDIMLPYVDGFEIAEIVRDKSPQMPILMLTARAGVEDKVKGLEFGADDYMTKPFHLKEILLRVSGMLKRKSWYKEATTNQPVYSFGGNKINFENLECSNNSGKFKLTQKEAMVLKYLIDNKEKIISRKELIEKVWHMNPEIETRTVDNFIVRLRKYFEPNPSEPIYFKSVRSVGYLFSLNK